MHPAILQAVTSEGYTTPTPIQMQAIPPVIKGCDLLGIAQTGTGKTAAFALPVLTRLASLENSRKPASTRALILVPTRELAIQVHESFVRYCGKLPFRTACVFGGVPDKNQRQILSTGVDILVATPGRLLDLLGQKVLSLNSLTIFILDEADRMLDMGFINDIRKIVAMLPKVRQNLFFSATMPRDIAGLASTILHNPVRVEVTPASTPIETIDQIVYPVEKKDKQKLLTRLLKDSTITRALVFTRTKHGANRVCEGLQKSGVNAAAIHGNKSQNSRQAAMEGFQNGKVRILVATDIAARGIDVEKVSHVFNFDLPEVPETYVHRIGRTARAGQSGVAISFCSLEERGYLNSIDKLIKRKIPRGEISNIKTPSTITPDSINSSTGRYDKDLGVFLPGKNKRPDSSYVNQKPKRQGVKITSNAPETSKRGGSSGPFKRSRLPRGKSSVTGTDSI